MSPQYQKIRADPRFDGVISESKLVAEHSTGEQERSSKDVETRLVDHATTPQQLDINDDEPAPNSDQPAPSNDQPAPINAEPAHDNDQPSPTKTQPPNKSFKSKHILLILNIILLPFFLIFLTLTLLLIWDIFVAGLLEGGLNITRLIVDGDLPSSDELVGVITGLLVVIAPMYFFFLWSVFARAGPQGS
jgi:hypothetical protein